MSTGLFQDEEDGYNIEETKYKLKLGNQSPAPAEDDSLDGLEDLGAEMPADDMGAEAPAVDDKPFDDTPFDAGVEADEESTPDKFIQQLAGKLGQSLRSYTENNGGQPDFDLEKFAVNSVLSATHTGEMDDQDRKDIIDKVNDSGKGDGQDVDVNVDVDTDADNADVDVNPQDAEGAPAEEEPALENETEILGEDRGNTCVQEFKQELSRVINGLYVPVEFFEKFFEKEFNSVKPENPNGYHPSDPNYPSDEDEMNWKSVFGEIEHYWANLQKEATKLYGGDGPYLYSNKKHDNGVSIEYILMGDNGYEDVRYCQDITEMLRQFNDVELNSIDNKSKLFFKVFGSQIYDTLVESGLGLRPNEREYYGESIDFSKKRGNFVDIIKKHLNEHHDMDYQNYGQYDSKEYMLDGPDITEAPEPQIAPAPTKPAVEPTRRQKTWRPNKQPQTQPKADDGMVNEDE